VNPDPDYPQNVSCPKAFPSKNFRKMLPKLYNHTDRQRQNEPFWQSIIINSFTIHYTDNAIYRP